MNLWKSSATIPWGGCVCVCVGEYAVCKKSPYLASAIICMVHNLQGFAMQMPHNMDTERLPSGVNLYACVRPLLGF